MSNRVGFMGEVCKAACECHAGKYLVNVFLIHPGSAEKVFLAKKAFDIEEEALSKLDDFIAEIAVITLKAHGLEPDMAKKTIGRGTEATRLERELVSEIKGLH